MSELLGLRPFSCEVEVVLTERNVTLVCVIFPDGLLYLGRARVLGTEMIEIELAPFQENRSAKLRPWTAIFAMGWSSLFIDT